MFGEEIDMKIVLDELVDATAAFKSLASEQSFACLNLFCKNPAIYESRNAEVDEI